MSLMEFPHAESGNCADITFEGDQVIKTSKWGLSYEDAVAEHDALLSYAGALAQEPIEVATLRSASLVTDQGLYHVRHATDVVYGESVLSLRGDERQAAVAQIANGISAMSTVDNPDRMYVGVDGTVKNWHMGPDGQPILIDLFPPLVRNNDGELKVGAIPGNYAHYERYLGTKSGVLTKMLFSAHNDNYPALSPKDCVRQVVKGADSWCYDVLPTDMDPVVKDGVRSELRLRFTPFLGSTMVRKVRNKRAG